MVKATGRSIAFSSLKITANFNLGIHHLIIQIRVCKSAGFSITHVLQVVPANFHSVVITRKGCRGWRGRHHHRYSKGCWWWHVNHIRVLHGNIPHWGWHWMGHNMRVSTWFTITPPTQEILANNCTILKGWMVQESALVCWSWTSSTCKISANLHLHLWVFHTNWSQ